jgi:uncharacterized protein (DUF924 family)
MALWQDEVLGFWFGELTHEERFGGAAEVDQKIRDRFEPLYRKLAAAIPSEALKDARTALATIIAYDQFPRNMYRRRPEAFATDTMAVQVARNALDKGLDAELAPEQKPFLYMPFMHSEVLADQERCVDLFKSTGNEEAIRFAVEHRDIIARFGRFPHRNKALGRKSIADEVEFLRGHSGYGQKSDEPEQA